MNSVQKPVTKVTSQKWCSTNVLYGQNCTVIMTARTDALHTPIFIWQPVKWLFWF